MSLMFYVHMAPLLVFTTLLHLVARAVGEEQSIISSWVDMISDSMVQDYRDSREKSLARLREVVESGEAFQAVTGLKLLSSRVEFNLDVATAELDRSLRDLTMHMALLPTARRQVHEQVHERVMHKLRHMNSGLI